MNKETIEMGFERTPKSSFYERHIRQKKIRLDMIICIFLLVFLQIGIYFAVRHVTTKSIEGSYVNSEYNDYDYYDSSSFSNRPIYSYSPSLSPSSGVIDYDYVRSVDLGISGDTSNVNRLVNEIKNVMTNKHERQNVLSEGDLEMIADYSKELKIEQEKTLKTEEKFDIQPNDIIKKPTTTTTNNNNIQTTVNIMEDIKKDQLNTDDSKLLRVGPKITKDLTENQLIYQFDPKNIGAIDISLPNYSVRMRSNITIRQAPPTSTNKNVMIIFNEYMEFSTQLSISNRFDDETFNLRVHGRGGYFGDYNNSPDVQLAIEIIFPPHINHFNMVSIYSRISHTHFDQSLKNIEFNTVAVFTDYGAVIAEHIKTKKLITTFFNGYLNGYFEVSKNLAVATYYGKIKPTIRCTSNDVHLLTIARYGSVHAYIDKNTFEGNIDIQSIDMPPSIYDTDLSSFKEPIMKPSPKLIRLQTSYKSLISDNHLLVSAGKNVSLTFGDINV